MASQQEEPATESKCDEEEEGFYTQIELAVEYFFDTITIWIWVIIALTIIIGISKWTIILLSGTMNW